MKWHVGGDHEADEVPRVDSVQWDLVEGSEPLMAELG